MKHTKNLTWKHILENVQLDETHCDLLTPFSRWRWFHREKLPKRRQPCVASHACRGSCECCSSRLYSQMSNFHSALGTSHPRATLLQPHHPKKVCAKESHQSSSYVWFSAWATFGPVWRGQFHSSACNMLENMKKQSWEKANNCNYCDFASSCSDVLKRHMKIHGVEKGKKMQPVWLRIILCEHIEDPFKTHTVENRQTTATIVTLHPLVQTFWRGIWKYIVE